jgi:Spondin_N
LKRLLYVGLAAAAVAAGAFAIPNVASASQATTWKVTVSNLTGNQPMSPPLFVVHDEDVDVWEPGTIASHVVAAIAEDANNAPAEEALSQVEGVHDVSTGEAGAIPPGESRTYHVTTQDRFDRLSAVTMLVNTNDGFTGLDSLRLHGNGGEVRDIAWDAGSESNNELRGFIPGPCCENPFVRDPNGKLVSPHEGITGRGELDPDEFGFSGEVAKFRIERAR